MHWGIDESRRLMEIVLEKTKPGVPIAQRWDQVAETYNSRSKHSATVKQITNHYNQCRYKWNAWREMSSFTGIELVDGLPTEEEQESERFKQFFQKHKAAGSYVAKHGLPDLDISTPIFAGKYATGALIYSPASAAADLSGGNKKPHGKGYVLGDEQEGSGDSVGCFVTPPPYVRPEEPAESRSPPSSKRSKQSFASVSQAKRSSELDKAFDILKMAQTHESFEKKLYQAVKNMEQVKQRGVAFQGKAILFLLEKSLGKMFLEFESEEEKWEWLKHLDNDSD